MRFLLWVAFVLFCAWLGLRFGDHLIRRNHRNGPP